MHSTLAIAEVQKLPVFVRYCEVRHKIKLVSAEKRIHTEILR